ncbi:MAG: OmpH family outer membrane protein [Bacteroidales bacterium]|jgi:outer membrane protein|nr:OmpH family outer membrane protein [Bacteroidales bacterium]
MKKLDLILAFEGVLLVAVIVLFVLFFTRNTPSGQVETELVPDGEVHAPVNGEIVYVKIDSLMQNYQMYKDLAEELREKSQKLDAELSNKQKKFQQDVTDFQNKAQKGLETRAKLAEMEQQLATDQQNLLQLRDNYAMQLQEEEQVMNRKSLQSIMDYLVEYNKDKGYQYIFGSSFGSNVLYSASSLDITTSVIDGINAQYRITHPEKK